jgi:hypothetical protein
MLRPKRQTSGTVTVTAPIGGWNAVNQLAAMSPNEAVIIDNWFCLPTELQSRKGYTPWQQEIAGNIESFITFDGQNGVAHTFAVADDAGDCSVWDVTTIYEDPDTHVITPPTEVVTGLTNARWYFGQVSTSGGTFTLAVNGEDYMLLYDGTAWQQVTDVSTPYAITGVDTSLLVGVLVHHRRAWFVQKDSMKCWYLATDAIAGAATSFDFAPLFINGGSIAKIETWTLDAGNGMDDYFVVITSVGEIAVYSGTNPADATTWSLNGVYYGGSPVGRSCTIKYGGDVLLLNKDGLVPLSQWLMSSRVNVKTSITNKIQKRITDATVAYAGNYGWQVVLSPPNNMLFINVPVSSTQFDQYVMNTISGAWSRFTGVNATCWAFVNNEMYFGQNGNVYKFWDGASDNGAIIETDLLPAFSSFGSQSQIKRWSMAKVAMGVDYTFNFSGLISTDFNLVTRPPEPTVVWNGVAGVWDAAYSTWDNVVWGSPDQAILPEMRWSMAGNMGYYGSYRIRTTSATADIRYYATDYVFEGGGVL